MGLKVSASILANRILSKPAEGEICMVQYTFLLSTCRAVRFSSYIHVVEHSEWVGIMCAGSVGLLHSEPHVIAFHSVMRY